jgi:hypothetical protein
VDATGARYAAPTLIHHYVIVHGYRPPQVFVDALMRALMSNGRLPDATRCALAVASP